MTLFEERVHSLQQRNKLVVLRRSGGVYAARVLDDLVQNYKVIDLALPSLRLQVEQDPERFVQGLQPPVYLAHLDYAPRLLQALLLSELPLGDFIASCSQCCYLEEQAGAAAENSQASNAECASEMDAELASKVVFLELPLQESTEVPAFVPAAEQLDGSLGSKPHRDVQQEIIAGSTAWLTSEKKEELGKGSLLKQAFLQMSAQESARSALESYVHRVLQQDIMERTTCSDDIKFYRFMSSVASIAGTVINYTALANSVGVTAPTARQWLHFLEGTGMVYLLQPLTSVPGKRMVKAPKLYFRDTAIAAFLLQINDVSHLAQSVYHKRLFENYVVNLLREGYLQQGLEPEWLFYRDSNAKEISLVLSKGRTIYPIVIDKDGVSAVKLQKSFAILEGHAAEKGLELGCGCLLTAKEGCKKLGEGLYQIDAAVL